jgi:hypothetical protein
VEGEDVEELLGRLEKAAYELGKHDALHDHVTPAAGSLIQEVVAVRTAIVEAWNRKKQEGG